MSETSRLPVAGLAAAQLLVAEYRRRQELAVGKYAVRIGQVNAGLASIAIGMLTDTELSEESKLRVAVLLEDRARAIAAKVESREGNRSCEPHESPEDAAPDDGEEDADPDE